MKFAAIFTVLLATGAIAAPYADAVAQPAPDTTELDSSLPLDELKTLLQEVEEYTNITLLGDDDSEQVKRGYYDGALDKRQTQASCYGLCDSGRAALRTLCAILPPTPPKVACYSAALALGTPLGKRVCRNFCNIFK